MQKQKNNCITLLGTEPSKFTEISKSAETVQQEEVINEG